MVVVGHIKDIIMTRRSTFYHVPSSRLETRGLTPCVGDGDRNSLNLDPVDADCLHRLSCWGELWRIQRYHPAGRGNFGQSSLLSPPCWRLLSANWGRCGGGGDRCGGRCCCGNRVLEQNWLPLAWCRFKNNLREENVSSTDLSCIKTDGHVSSYYQHQWGQGWAPNMFAHAFVWYCKRAEILVQFQKSFPNGSRPFRSQDRCSNCLYTTVLKS